MGRIPFPAGVVSLLCLGHSMLFAAPCRAGETAEEEGAVPAASVTPVDVAGFRSVKFVPEDPGQSFVVMVDASLTCRTPCELALPDGAHELDVSGDAAFAQQIVVGEGSSVVTIEKTHHYGLALMLAGTGVGIAGFFLAAVPRAPCDPAESAGCEPGTDQNRTVRNVGRAMLVTGGLCAITGLVLGSIRTNRLELAGSRVTRADERSDEPRLIGLAVGPAGGGTLALGATFSF